MLSNTSREKAEAHEALFLRLDALLGHLEALAARHAAAAVPQETLAIAEGLLFDAQPFMPPHPVRRGDQPGAPRVMGFPAATDSCAALTSQLGQARAALQMWEAAHSGWDGQCYVWRLTRGDTVPIGRLRPQARATLKSPEDIRATAGLREQLMRHIDARFDEGYRTGYADAGAGIAPRTEEFTIAARTARLNQS